MAARLAGAPKRFNAYSNGSSLGLAINEEVAMVARLRIAKHP
jgi:hypothetical protein